jgi:hypothetical protein
MALTIHGKNLKYNTKNIDEYNTDKDIEAHAVHFNSIYNKLCILTIYKSPMGNNQLEFILQKLYKWKYHMW